VMDPRGISLVSHTEMSSGQVSMSSEPPDDPPDDAPDDAPEDPSSSSAAPPAFVLRARTTGAGGGTGAGAGWRTARGCDFAGAAALGMAVDDTDRPEMAVVCAALLLPLPLLLLGTLLDVAVASGTLAGLMKALGICLVSHREISNGHVSMSSSSSLLQLPDVVVPVLVRSEGRSPLVFNSTSRSTRRFEVVIDAAGAEGAAAAAVVVTAAGGAVVLVVTAGGAAGTGAAAASVRFFRHSMGSKLFI
jgi:hypothetical protein